MSVVSILSKALLLCAVSAALTGASVAAEDDGRKPTSGKAAAHAALSDGADFPDTPPSLPDVAVDHARRAPDVAPASKKVDVVREAQNQADERAADNAARARDEAAVRTAQAAVSSALRSANADARSAAAQARTNGARAKAGGHPPVPRPTAGRP